MSNPLTPRVLWLALAAEIIFGLLCLVLSRNWSSLIVITGIFGLLAALSFGVRQLKSGAGGGHQRQTEWNRVGGFDTVGSVGGENAMPGKKPANWNLGNISFNLSNYPEQTAVSQQVFPVEDGLTAFKVNILNGAVRLVGQAGLSEIRLTATRRVWTIDQLAARSEFDRLQIRAWRENNIFNIEAGDPTQGLVVGHGSRLDLELIVPDDLAANLITNQGEISCRRYRGELVAQAMVGAISIEDYNSGRDITLNTTSGRINLQTVAAGVIKARSGAGTLQLTGVGAEAVDLETTAGMIRTRGINCGRFAALAITGSVELLDATIEMGLQLKTGAGRILANNVRPAYFKLEAATGQISYQGAVPTEASEVNSGVGSVQLTFNPGAGFDLDAHSNIGAVDAYLPVTMSGFQNRTTFQGQIAGGGPPVKIASQIGSVRVAMN